MSASLLDSARGSIAGIAWPPLVEGPAATVLALARHLEAAQWLEREAIAERQFAQLRSLVQWLGDHSPAFARRLREAGLTGEALASPDGFAALPPIERRWFQSEPDIESDAVPRGHEPFGVAVTSGSTGEVLRVRRTRANQLVWLAMLLREHVWQGTDFSVPLATMRATNPRIARFPDWGPPVSLLYETGPALTLPIGLEGDVVLDQLLAFRPGNLVIYPNALHVLLEAVERRGAALDGLQAIRTVGEVVTPALRERTRAALGLEIADAYTSQEAGYLALQCPASGLYHLMAESALVEVLRADGSVCGEGETGRVAVTDLHNFATPVVRYLIGDLAEVGPPCPCGRGLPTLTGIVGRNRNLIRYPDGTRRWPSHGGFGPQGYLKLVPILQYQCVQSEPDLIEMRLVTVRPLRPDEEQLVVERMQAALGFPFRIEFRYFEGRLPVPSSGKFEDFICLV